MADQLKMDDAMLRSLLQQELDKEAMAKRMTTRKDVESAPSIGSIPPGLASLGGAALDALSTYKFLKNKSAVEDNALYAHGSPASTAAIGGSVGPLAYLLLKRKYPGVAKMWGSMVGAHQLGLGALNLMPNPEGSSFDKLDAKINAETFRKK